MQQHARIYVAAIASAVNNDPKCEIFNITFTYYLSKGAKSELSFLSL